MQLEAGMPTNRPSHRPERKLEFRISGDQSVSYSPSCLTSQLISTLPLQGIFSRWAPVWSPRLSGIYTACCINGSRKSLPDRMPGAQSWGRGQNRKKGLRTSLSQPVVFSMGYSILVSAEDFPGMTRIRGFLKGINLHILNFHINSFLKIISPRMHLGCSTPPHLLFKYFFSYFIF